MTDRFYAARFFRECWIVVDNDQELGSKDRRVATFVGFAAETCARLEAERRNRIEARRHKSAAQVKEGPSHDEASDPAPERA